MRVVKVLNNSLVLALDEKGQETILMGKGIGYQKSIGYQFQENEIEKVFILKDKEMSRNIIRLASETDSVYFELAKTVIDYAEEVFHMKLMDHIYLSLTDHLSFAAQRVRDGIVLRNFYTMEMKKFNPNEFQVGEYAVTLMNEQLGMEIPFAAQRVRDGIVLRNFYTMEMKKFNPNEFQVGEYAVTLMNEQLGMEIPMDEAGNIAFHFINAQYQHPYNSQNLMIAGTVNDLLDIVKYSFGISYQEDSTAYSRFVTHLRLFAQRLVSRKLLPEDKSDLLYEQIYAVCSEEFGCVEKIQIYVMDKFHQTLSNQENMYLALHIHRVLEEQKNIR